MSKRVSFTNKVNTETNNSDSGIPTLEQQERYTQSVNSKTGNKLRLGFPNYPRGTISRFDNKKKKRGKNKTVKKTLKSKRNCNKVPCGSCNPYCKPTYCYNKHTVSTKNWCDCNMLNISNKTRKTNKNMKEKCKQEKMNYIPQESKIKESVIPIKELNSKMPYIWRFLRQGTKKEILRLAQLDVDEIGIMMSFH